MGHAFWALSDDGFSPFFYSTPKMHDPPFFFKYSTNFLLAVGNGQSYLCGVDKMNPPIRLLIVDDSSDFRLSLEQLFQTTEDVEVIGVLSDGSQVAGVLQKRLPDVVLMDIDMPLTNGIVATAQLKALSPKTQVVMLTVSETEDRIFEALRNGATGYLLKKASPEEIIDAVYTVHRGGSPISPAIARKVLQFFYSEQRSNLLSAQPALAGQTVESDFSSMGLTPREHEILEGLVDGLSYKMIASRFFISADTVKNHIQGIYRKMHVNSKGEAISLALKRGLVG